MNGPSVMFPEFSDIDNYVVDLATFLDCPPSKSCWKLTYFLTLVSAHAFVREKAL
jgi:hypothetical protein